MSFLDRLLAPLGYAKASKPAPSIEFDVAISMRDNQDNQSPLITCIMSDREYKRLSDDWVQAISQKITRRTAGFYFMMADGLLTYHGFILSNIESVTAVQVMPKGKSTT